MIQAKNGRFPNVILIVMDTTRAHNLSCYGYHRQTTPFLDAFAGESTLYTNATSASSWTLPAHASLFTGTFPSRHTAYGWQSKLPTRFKTMAEFFTDLGYETVAFTSNGWVSDVYGLSRGFKTFYKNWQLLHIETDLFRTYKLMHEEAGVGQRINALVQGTLCHGHPIKNLLNAIYGRCFRRAFDYGARKANRRIQQWYTSTRDKEKPFFLFVNYMEPHLRYEAPGRYRYLHVADEVSRARVKSVNQNAAKYMCGTVEMGTEDFEILEALYDGEISYLDAKIKELLNFFDGHGELDCSVVMITSDHGENIGDHGLMSHFYSLHESLIHVPLIIQWPGKSDSSRLVSDPVQLVDLFPTLIDFFKMDDLPWTTVFQGASLLSSPPPGGRYALAELLAPNPPLPMLIRKGGGVCKPVDHYAQMLCAVRDNRFKYLWSSNGQEDMYDLVADPDESQNLAAQMPSQLAEFRTFREAWQRQAQTTGGEMSPAEPDQVVLRRLEDLGYL